MREIRVSPDGESVAIRSDAPEGAWNTWGFFNAVNGGGWVGDAQVTDWTVVDAPA